MAATRKAALKEVRILNESRVMDRGPERGIREVEGAWEWSGGKGCVEDGRKKKDDRVRRLLYLSHYDGGGRFVLEEDKHRGHGVGSRWLRRIRLSSGVCKGRSF